MQRTRAYNKMPYAIYSDVSEYSTTYSFQEDIEDIYYVLIIVDNEDELENVISIALQEKNGARIGFRVIEFLYWSEALQIRFGFDLNQIKGLA